jgi:hypothetical protein
MRCLRTSARSGSPRDSPGKRGRPILLSMAEDGIYHSQFVRGTSNGGLTARPGR